MLEIEAKIKVTSLDPVRTKLMALMARKLPAVKEVNMFFDLPDRSLQAGDKGLRIRLETSEENPLPKALMTYKGPRQRSALHPREAFDLSVSPPNDAIAFLQALGYERTLSYEKHRESWLIESCRVELDELPYLGTFVEIEGPSEKAITAVREKLGLAHHELTKPSYAAMMSHYLQEHNIPDRTVIFR
jgi:adenylate cyclase, class 2